MDASQTLACEINIIRAKNVELKSDGKLFVRCYLAAGNNQRVRLDTREGSSAPHPAFDESFSLECSGSEESIRSLVREKVVFELRWRSRVPVLARVCKSRALGRVEVPWTSVFDAEEMKIEKWIPMASTGSSIIDQDCKPPALQVSMKVRLPAPVPAGERSRRGGRWDECGCTDGGCACVDADHMLALAAALEAL